MHCIGFARYPAITDVYCRLVKNILFQFLAPFQEQRTQSNAVSLITTEQGMSLAEPRQELNGIDDIDIEYRQRERCLREYRSIWHPFKCGHPRVDIHLVVVFGVHLGDDDHKSIECTPRRVHGYISYIHLA